MQRHRSASFFRGAFSIVFLAFCLLESPSAQPSNSMTQPIQFDPRIYGGQALSTDTPPVFLPHTAAPVAVPPVDVPFAKAAAAGTASLSIGKALNAAANVPVASMDESMRAAFRETSPSVEKINPDNLGRWGVDGYEIYVSIDCSISRYTFIPTKVCRQPYIVIGRQTTAGTDSISPNRSTYFQLSAKEILVGDKWIFDGSNDSQKNRPFSEMIASGPQRSEELFSLLMASPDTQLKFMTRAGPSSAIKTRAIILSNFKPNTDRLINQINYNFDQEENSARRRGLLGVALLVVFLSITLWGAIFLIKRGRQQLRIVKERIDIRRVVRVAEDEAIREVVRNGVQKADHSSLEALRSQIKAALDSGDTKTAEELLKLLKKLS